MRFYYWITCALFIANAAWGETLSPLEQVQVPNCLAKHLTTNHTILAEDNEFKIVTIPSAQLEELIYLADKINCGRFINVTDMLAESPLTTLNARANELLKKPEQIKVPPTLSYSLRHPSEVNEAINQVNIDNILANLTHMTEYENRSATKKTGVATAEWLKSEFERMAKENNRMDVKTYFVKTGFRYKQPSVVAVIGSNLKTPAIVIGAHMDTLDGRMPGAGDDASGSAGILEMARIVLASPRKLDHPVYFVWYAAEERGLVGSQFVVNDFLKKFIAVKAVIQFDMIGYRTDVDDPTMWVYRDYTDEPLSDFVMELIQAYIHVPVKVSTCGYGCSDHASWTKKGIPAAFPCETDFEHHNSAIHTENDTLDRLTPQHMINFTKLGLAFAIELATD